MEYLRGDQSIAERFEENERPRYGMIGLDVIVGKDTTAAETATNGEEQVALQSVKKANTYDGLGDNMEGVESSCSTTSSTRSKEEADNDDDDDDEDDDDNSDDDSSVEDVDKLLRRAQRRIYQQKLQTEVQQLKEQMKKMQEETRQAQLKVVGLEAQKRNLENELAQREVQHSKEAARLNELTQSLVQGRARMEMNLNKEKAQMHKRMQQMERYYKTEVSRRDNQIAKLSSGQEPRRGFLERSQSGIPKTDVLNMSWKQLFNGSMSQLLPPTPEKTLKKEPVRSRPSTPPRTEPQAPEGAKTVVVGGKKNVVVTKTPIRAPPSNPEGNTANRPLKVKMDKDGLYWA